MRIIKPRLAFEIDKANGKDGEKDQDDFFLAKRYGYDAEFSISCVIDPTSPHFDGIQIDLKEQDGSRRALSIFIPRDHEQPVDVCESMLTRIPITHNNNENEENNTTN